MQAEKGIVPKIIRFFDCASYEHDRDVLSKSFDQLRAVATDAVQKYHTADVKFAIMLPKKFKLDIRHNSNNIQIAINHPSEIDNKKYIAGNCEVSLHDPEDKFTGITKIYDYTTDHAHRVTAIVSILNAKTIQDMLEKRDMSYIWNSLNIVATKMIESELGRSGLEQGEAMTKKLGSFSTLFIVDYFKVTDYLAPLYRSMPVFSVKFNAWHNYRKAGNAESSFTGVIYAMVSEKAAWENIVGKKGDGKYTYTEFSELSQDDWVKYTTDKRACKTEYPYLYYFLKGNGHEYTDKPIDRDTYTRETFTCRMLQVNYPYDKFDIRSATCTSITNAFPNELFVTCNVGERVSYARMNGEIYRRVHRAISNVIGTDRPFSMPSGKKEGMAKFSKWVLNVPGVNSWHYLGQLYTMIGVLRELEGSDVLEIFFSFNSRNSVLPKLQKNTLSGIKYDRNADPRYIPMWDKRYKPAYENALAIKQKEIEAFNLSGKSAGVKLDAYMLGVDNSITRSEAIEAYTIVSKISKYTKIDHLIFIENIWKESFGKPDKWNHIARKYLYDSIIKAYVDNNNALEIKFKQGDIKRNVFTANFHINARAAMSAAVKAGESAHYILSKIDRANPSYPNYMQALERKAHMEARKLRGSDNHLTDMFMNKWDPVDSDITYVVVIMEGKDVMENTDVTESDMDWYRRIVTHRPVLTVGDIARMHKIAQHTNEELPEIPTDNDPRGKEDNAFMLTTVLARYCRNVTGEVSELVKSYLESIDVDDRLHALRLILSNKDIINQWYNSGFKDITAVSGFKPPLTKVPVLKTVNNVLPYILKNMPSGTIEEKCALDVLYSCITPIWENDVYVGADTYAHEDKIHVIKNLVKDMYLAARQDATKYHRIKSWGMIKFTESDEDKAKIDKMAKEMLETDIADKYSLADTSKFIFVPDLSYPMYEAVGNAFNVKVVSSEMFNKYRTEEVQLRNKLYEARLVLRRAEEAAELKNKRDIEINIKGLESKIAKLEEELEDPDNDMYEIQKKISMAKHSIDNLRDRISINPDFYIGVNELEDKYNALMEAAYGDVKQMRHNFYQDRLLETRTNIEDLKLNKQIKDLKTRNAKDRSTWDAMKVDSEELQAQYQSLQSKHMDALIEDTDTWPDGFKSNYLNLLAAHKEEIDEQEESYWTTDRARKKQIKELTEDDAVVIKKIQAKRDKAKLDYEAMIKSLKQDFDKQKKTLFKHLYLPHVKAGGNPILKTLINTRNKIDTLETEMSTISQGISNREGEIRKIENRIDKLMDDAKNAEMFIKRLTKVLSKHLESSADFNMVKNNIYQLARETYHREEFDKNVTTYDPSYAYSQEVIDTPGTLSNFIYNHVMDVAYVSCTISNKYIKLTMPDQSVMRNKEGWTSSEGSDIATDNEGTEPEPEADIVQIGPMYVPDVTQEVQFYKAIYY